MNNELIEKVCMSILFDRKWYDADVITILNDAQDHRPCKVYTSRNGYMSLSYCGRCSTIVGEGDRFCSFCGRALRWE